MNAAEFRQARSTIASGRESLEQWMGLATDDLDQWAAGDIPIPHQRAKQVQWVLQFVEREKRMVAMGIGECEWAESQQPWDGGEVPTDGDLALKEYQEYLAGLEEHKKKCDLCRTRERYWQDNPLPPFPQLGVFASLVAFFNRWRARTR